MGLGSLPPRSQVDTTVHTDGGKTYQRRWVYCGKANCKRCPHGPYWYKLVNRGAGGTPRWRYAGKIAPPEIESENDLLTHDGDQP